jgi:hypothetical protein
VTVYFSNIMEANAESSIDAEIEDDQTDGGRRAA